MHRINTFLNGIFPRPFNIGETRTLPRSPKLEDSSFHALFNYQNIMVRRLIHYIKKYRDPQLCKKLAEQIHALLYSKDIIEEQELPILIIPVPIDSLKKSQRGFNQTELTARYLHKLVKNSAYHPRLLRKKQNEKQALLDKESRRKNVKDIFSPRKKLPLHSQIIIVDDLITTGATMRELRKVLKKNGGKNIHGVSIAH